MGNRIAKHVITAAETASTYSLDAQGNQMSVYTYSTDNTNLYLAERNIYGSSRIGQEQLQKIMVLNQIANNPNYHTNLVLGNKRYELSNHLGNVLNVITDRKLANNGGSGSVVAYYTADVVSFSDYDPFGMLMPGRHETAGDYRYSFQGQEGDPEIKGEGNSVNYSFRMHDPRLGRFFAVDPLAASYAYNSPYAFSENRVLDGVELEGREFDALNTFAEAIVRNIASGVTLVSTVVANGIINQVYVISQEGIHEGGSNQGNNLDWAVPYVIDEHWDFVKRSDLMREELTPEQGKEIVNATVSTITLVAPIKVPIAGNPAIVKIGEKGIPIILKAGIKKTASEGMDQVIKASDKKKPTKSTPLDDAVKDLDKMITVEKTILNDHLDQLKILKSNNASYEDINNVYKQLKEDYGRIKSLRIKRDFISKCANMLN